MFLERAAQLGLLGHNPETAVIRDFPLNIRKVLVSQVVNFLSDSTIPRQILVSRAHVTWAMECVGQAFSLPIEESSVIENAIDIYWMWLTSPATRPDPIDDDEQAIIQDIFKHYSLIFEARPGTQSRSGEMRQVGLCKRVIEIYDLSSKENGQCFSEDTWEVLLKVVLSVADYLMRSRLPSETLPSELLPGLLRVGCDLIMRSTTRNLYLWDAWTELYSQWGHRLPAVVQWNATCMALTLAAARLLCGPSEGTEDVVISLSGVSSCLSFEDDYVFFLWHMFLRIMGDPNSLADPVIYKHAMQGVADISDFLVTVGTRGVRSSATGCSVVEVGKLSNVVAQKEEGYTVLPPDADTVLSVVGKWLFDAVALPKTTHEEGRAVAIGALCRIFTRRGGKPPSQPNTMRFYDALTEVLSAAGLGRMKTAVVLNCTRLLSSEMEGVRILVAPFLDLLRQILVNAHLPFQVPCPVEQLRGACITIAGCLPCLASHFSDVELVGHVAMGGRRERNTTENSKPENTTEKYEQLRPQLLDMLVGSLQMEKDASNARALLWTLYVLVADTDRYVEENATDLTRSWDLTWQAISTLEKMFFAPEAWQNRRVPTAVMKCALSVMSAFTALRGIAKLSGDGEQASPVDRKLCTDVLQFLCRFIRQSLVSPPHGVPASDFEEVLAHAFGCVLDWVMDVRFLLTDFGGLKVLFEVIEFGLSRSKDPFGKEQGSSPLRVRGSNEAMAQNVTIPRGVRMAAQAALLCVLHSGGHFPPPTGAQCSGTLLKYGLHSACGVQWLIAGGDREMDVVPDAAVLGSDGAVSSRYVRYFVFDESIIVALVEQPQPRNPSVTVFFRSVMGRSAWEFRSMYVPYDRMESAEGEQAVPSSVSMSVNESATPASPLPEGGHKEVSGKMAEENATSSPASLLLVEQPRGEGRGGGGPDDALDETGRVRQQAFLRSVEAQTKLEAASMGLSVHKGKETERRRESELFDTRITPPARPNIYGGPCAFQDGRRLLSDLGWIQLDNRALVAPLEQSTKLDRSVNLLDHLSVREGLTVSVLYAGAGQTTLVEMLKNTQGSEDYQGFVRGLGWLVYLPTHEGFLGRLDRHGCGPHAPYFATYSAEVMFHVLTMMPAGTSKADSMRRQLVNSDVVQVIWWEDSRDFRPAPLSGGSVHLYVVVRPMKDGLYTVRLLAAGDESREMMVNGVLQDGMVVRRAVLAPLVRQTCMDACRLSFRLSSLAASHSGPLALGGVMPLVLRGEHIHTITERYRRKVNPQKGHALLFSGEALRPPQLSHVSPPLDGVDKSVPGSSPPMVAVSPPATPAAPTASHLHEMGVDRTLSVPPRLT